MKSNPPARASRRAAFMAAALCSLASVAHADDPTAPVASGASAIEPGRIKAEKSNCRPEYPVQALREHAQGTTRVRFTIDATGHVTNAEIVQSAGQTPAHLLLDQAASGALASCPFRPGKDATGQPAGTTVEVSYRWVLE